MGVFDRPLFDFNGDGKTDFMEWSVGMQMTASSRQEAIDLTGDDTFYPGSDTLEEDDDELDLYGLDRDDLEMMDEEDMRIDLEDVGLEPDNYDDF
ncbi:MAG: uroporphyrin-III methyltransferase [Agathobacter sp.]|nr:uroporphyrin-III methyltransferase [Agathobacter sp.]